MSIALDSVTQDRAALQAELPDGTGRGSSVAGASTIAGANTIAGGIAVMLALMVVQRLAGFLRGILFCRWLDPQQLGEWDLAFGFLMLAAPLAVLGLPGSFGRYVEHYRQRRQLRVFLVRTTVVSTVMAIAASALVVLQGRWFAEQIFGDPGRARLAALLALSLGVVIAHNYLVSLFIAVRMYRVVSGLQFFQTMLFMAFGLGLISCWRADAGSVILAYGAASLVSALIYVRQLKDVWRHAPPPAEITRQRTFWVRLLPFAMWIWVTNLLSNLFDLIDRYMIIHYSGMSESEALVQVGNLHSSRIIPLLFVSVAILLGSIITPHLSHDWEAGRRAAVSRRLNLTIKLLGLALLAGSTCVLLAAPLLFTFVLEGKFAGGLAVLPYTFMACAWFGIGAVAQNYLWCAEKAGLGSLALLVGLVVNVCLNLVLLPRFGLQGAVWSTSAANVITLALFYFFSRRHGMQVDRGTWVISLAPAVLCLGPWVSLLVLLAFVVVAKQTAWLLTNEEKRELQTVLSGLIEKARFWRGAVLST